MDIESILVRTYRGIAVDEQRPRRSPTATDAGGVQQAAQLDLQGGRSARAPRD